MWEESEKALAKGCYEKAESYAEMAAWLAGDGEAEEKKEELEKKAGERKRILRWKRMGIMALLFIWGLVLSAGWYNYRLVEMEKNYERKMAAFREQLAHAQALLREEEMGFVYYRIKKGDTLYGLAYSFYGDSSRWREICRVNPGIDPFLMQPGQVIKIPHLTDDGKKKE